jgi:DNA-binding protein HU-beta
MGKSELFSHFAERFEVKRTQAREYFDELTALAEKELKRSGEFVLPGMVKLVVQKRKARMGRNPATGEAIKIPAKTVVKARIASSSRTLSYRGVTARSRRDRARDSSPHLTVNSDPRAAAARVAAARRPPDTPQAAVTRASHRL